MSDNQTYKQLMLTDEGNITTEQKQFISLHQEIMNSGNRAAEYALQMAEGLKEMRDKKLYHAAGYEEFGEYVEDAVGLKERQAYNYIKIFEEFSKSFLQSNAKLGVTKLSLLAGLSEYDRAAVMENTDVESTSVRELKEQIAELTTKNEQLSLDMDALMSAGQNTDEYDELVKAHDKAKSEAAANLAKADSLQKEKTKLQSELETLKRAPAAKETVDNPETLKKVAELEAQIRTKDSELDSTKKQLIIAGDVTMTKFKVKFEDFQRVGMETVALLNEMDDAKRIKCGLAFSAVLEKLTHERKGDEE